MQKYKTRLKPDVMEAINTLIEKVTIIDRNPTDDDKMHIALLAEVHSMFQKKLIDQQRDYLVKFSPAQAFALRILNNDYVNDFTSSFGNKLHQIANEVHQQYN